ncbi:MAG: hypothetical protein F6K23_11765 [Okeania sp. SIO2C9]|uniref:hypothetical protein n=1 Tax=Okeania sp. SIO2C9 TaxID=2607791 RepID=UPI0013BFFEAD|nr:hypothetical protein [Okeania sp. SIO2C9]NEQ73667.1 hypothetical protein [Okeania sp. SIO2C9]
MNRDQKSPISTVGDSAWWKRDSFNRDDVNAATQQQCQSSCSSGNGGCAPSKSSLPSRRRVIR